MKVEVLLFAGLAEEAGLRRLHLDLPEGSTVGAALDHLAQRLPVLAPWRRRVAAAVNRNYADPETLLRDGDVLALIPPVSGGGDGGAAPEGDCGETVGAGEAEVSRAGGRYRVTLLPLSADAAASLVADPAAGHAGAVATFTGVVRRYTGEHVTDHLVYEAYAPMAVEEMRRLGGEIEARWPGTRVAMHHRTGRLEVGEASVVIAVAAPHRDDAFEACRFAIDALKVRVPVWKKEVYQDGSYWVGRDGSHPGSGTVG